MVLLALADASNDSGVCYPSLRSLERKTSLTKRTVLSKLKLLEEKGLLWKPESARVLTRPESAAEFRRPSGVNRVR